MNNLKPQTAIALTFLWAVLTLVVEGVWPLIGLTALAAVYWLAVGGASQARVVGVALAITTWSLLLTQGLFYMGSPRTVWFTVLPAAWFPLGDPPGLVVIKEGLAHGLVQSLRLDLMVFLAGGLISRYGADQLAMGLRALRFPPALTFLFSLGLRFLPEMWREVRGAWMTQRLRGFRLMAWPGHGNGWVHLPRVMLLPLLMANRRRAEELAAALRSRGVTPEEPGLLAAPAMTRWERAVLLAGGIGLTAYLFSQSSAWPALAAWMGGSG